ncbi:MAG: serine/threonine-protein kinase [Rhodanobacteraceae bacterium]
MDRKRVDELFDQLFEIAPGQRVAWLDRTCADDAALRAELERMLRIDAKASAFLESPPNLVADRLASATIEAPAHFGPWRVLRSIGIGGMGEVWLAERSDGEFEQRVAIKQLAYPTPGLLQRFRQERQILARLEHPRIARLIDGGVDAKGAPYLVMEYVEGVPITTYAQDHALDLPASLRLFLRVCEAVQYAHQNLIVHRDLKPANIFVTPEGSPKLLDFGIAKVLATTDDAASTQTAARMLTPDYAAPEQFTGDPITTATDVYALGVVLYELLTGKRPLASATDRNSGVYPMPPSAAIERTAKNAGARRRLLRGDLDRIALTALAAEPSHRYASAEALAGDIRCYLAGRAIAARGDRAWYRLRKFAWRNRYAVGAVAAVVVVSIIAAIVSLHQAALAREQAARAEAVRQFLVGVFQQASPDESKGQPITARQLLEKGEQQLHAIDDSQQVIRADLTTLIARLFWDIGDTEHAAQLMPILQATAEEPHIPDQVRADTLIELARVEIDRRMFDQAMVHARRALSLTDSIGKSGVQQASEARHLLTSVMVEQNDPAAESLLRRALTADVIAHGERSDEVTGDLLSLGLVLNGLSRRDEAIAVLRKQLALARNLHGDLNSSVINGLNALALTFLQKGNWNASESTYREALDAERQLLGPDHASTIIIHSNLLAVMERQGHFANALHERLQMLHQRKNARDSMREDSVALVTHLVGFDYRELGQFDKAEAAARDALAIWHRVQPSVDAIDSAPPMENLGVILYLQGRYVESEDALRHAIAIMLERTSPSSQWLARMRGELADTLRGAHRYSEALQEASAAANVLSSTLKSSHDADLVLARLQAQLSEAQLDTGDPVSAEKTACEALNLSRRALPPGNYQLGIELFALARAEFSLGKLGSTESLLREALAVRSPPHPADDPRVLEVKVSLVEALTALGKNDEARRLTVEVEPILRASRSPYAADLLKRIPTR